MSKLCFSVLGAIREELVANIVKYVGFWGNMTLLVFRRYMGYLLTGSVCRTTCRSTGSMDRRGVVLGLEGFLLPLLLFC